MTAHTGWLDWLIEWMTAASSGQWRSASESAEPVPARDLTPEEREIELRVFMTNWM